MHVLRTALRRASACALVAAAAACADAPTSPQAYQHAAAGRTWTAVTVPAGVPSADTWLPYIRPSDGGDARRRVLQLRGLREEALRLRRTGDLLAARATEEHAAVLAAESVTRPPPAAVIASAIGALERWCAQVERVPGLAAVPELDGAAREVRALVAASRGALAAGDTLAAVAAVTAAGRHVRDHAPETVALAAIERVAAGISAERSRDAARALRLLESAREALAAGNYPRAFRRAMYALQLAEPTAAAAVEPTGDLR